MTRDWIALPCRLLLAAALSARCRRRCRRTRCPKTFRSTPSPSASARGRRRPTTRRPRPAWPWAASCSSTRSCRTTAPSPAPPATGPTTGSPARTRGRSASAAGRARAGADAVQPRLRHRVLLGRPGRDAGGAGPGADRQPGRDGVERRRRGRPAEGRRRLPGAVRGRVRRRRDGRQPGQGAGELRAQCCSAATARWTSSASRASATALTDAERHGLWLYESKGQCWRCHAGKNFTDEGFHNTGVSWGGADLGRHAVTKSDADRGKFKTPTLRGRQADGRRTCTTAA